VRPLARFWVFAVIAIVLPAAIVAVLAVLSLRQWEASAELLFREQARDVASMAAEKVEMVMRRSEDELLARLQAALSSDEAGQVALEEFLAGTRLVDGLALASRQGRILYSAGAEAAAVAQALLAELSPAFWESGGRRHLMVGQAPLLTAVLRERGGGGPVAVALAASPEGLRREIFEKSLAGLEAPTIVAILDAEGRTVWSREPLPGAQPLLTVPFRERLPRWRVALYQPPGTSPGETVRRQVMIVMATLGVLLVVIVAGLVATWRLVRRETEMARLKADFVANVSHDLKTPLSVIRMFGETLEMGRLPDEAARREYYRVIARESERLSRLIDNVLDFSRIEGGRRTYQRRPTAVEPLVRDTLEAFSYPLAQQGFKVEVQVAPDLPEVALDFDAVGQALTNLIDNAIKYSGERRVLRVEARVVDGRLGITVGDEGLGIPREEHARIFDKFYRVGRSETQGRRGSGMGLALVRHVAEAHGGEVTVESRPGEGSRFTLWIPV
jgi:signal transduction histidine kinase